MIREHLSMNRLLPIAVAAATATKHSFVVFNPCPGHNEAT